MLIAVFGVLSASPDAALLRILQLRLGASSNMIVFWKSIWKTILICVFVWCTKPATGAVNGMLRGPKFCGIPAFLLFGSILQATIEFGFTNMVLETTVARALLLYSLNPIWSAILGWAILGDILPRRTIAALVLATVSILLIFGPSIILHQSEAGSSTRGDLIAIATGLATSGYICMVRAAEKQDSLIYTVPCVMLGSCLSWLLLGSIFLANGSTFLPERKSSQLQLAEFFLLSVVDSLCVAAILVALTIAPRTLSGAEVSLVTLLETVLGPFIVFLVFGDKPDTWTLAGGALLLVTLAVHELAGMHASQKPTSGTESKMIDTELPTKAPSVELDASTETSL